MRVKTFTTFLFLVLFTVSALADDVKVIVYNYDGRAKTVRNKKTVPVDLDMTCQNNDLYRTESDSFIDFTVQDLGGLRVFESAEIVTTNTNPSNLMFTLLSGTVLTNLREFPEGSAFQLDTPLATIWVNKGGQFLARVKKDGAGMTTVFVSVRKGALRISAKKSGAAVSLLQGQAMEIPDQEGYIPTPRSATEEENDAMHKASGIYIIEALPSNNNDS